MGYTGTLKYLKSASAGIIWNISGQNKPQWVRMTTNRGSRQIPDIFDVFGSFDDSVLIRVSKLFRAIKFTSPTKEQVRKRLGAISSPYMGTSDFSETFALLKLGFESSFPSVIEFDEKVAVPSVARQFRQVTSVSGKTKVTFAPPLFESLLWVKSNKDLIEIPNWERAFLPLEFKKPMLDSTLYSLDPDPTMAGFLGEIHATQEGGGKLRVFAAPYTIVQSVLFPIHVHVRKYIDSLLENCILDQLSGARRIQAWLLEGRTVHSVDQETATCLCPVEPQDYVLELMGVPEKYRRFYRYCFKGKWHVGTELVSTGLFPEWVQWVVGQPLGTIPSMSGYAAFLNFLLRGICYMLGKDPFETFVSLGDDLAIADDEVYGVFLYICNQLGMKINTEKSYSSCIYAEFAGASITRDIILRPGQWKAISFQNLVEYSEDFGKLSSSEARYFSVTAMDAVNAFRFERGTYVPASTEEYQLLLRINSLVLAESNPLDWTPLTSVPYSQGIRSAISDDRRISPFLFRIESDENTKLELLLAKHIQGLRHNIPRTASPYGVRYAIHSLLSWTYGTGFTVWDSIYRAWTFLLCCLMDSKFGYTELCEALQKFEDESMELLWLPPVKKTVTSRLKQYVKVAATLRISSL
jgi:hypothetical protein